MHYSADLITFLQRALLLDSKNMVFDTGERYDFVIGAKNNIGAYWIQVRGLGECGIKRAQQLGILRYARGPYQPSTPAPTYDVGIPQGVVRIPTDHNDTIHI